MRIPVSRSGDRFQRFSALRQLGVVFVVCAMGLVLFTAVVAKSGTTSTETAKFVNSLPNLQSTNRGCGDDPEDTNWLIYNRSACVQLWNETRGWGLTKGVPTLSKTAGIPFTSAGYEDIHGKYIGQTGQICPGGYAWAKTYNSGSTAVGPETIYHWGYFSSKPSETCRSPRARAMASTHGVAPRYLSPAIPPEATRPWVLAPIRSGITS